LKKTTSTPDFTEQVWRECARIPRGNVSTYGKIARAIGRPGAARAVGNALNKSPGMPKVPCHRVVRGNGKIGGFARGKRAKIRLLEKEGASIQNGKVKDFNKKMV